jgi:hypothetical protein
VIGTQHLRAIENHGYFGLRGATMCSQAVPLQAVKIVLTCCPADAGIRFGHHHIALPIWRHIKQAASGLFVQSQLNTLQPDDPADDGLGADLARTPHPHKPTQRAMVHDKFVLDGANVRCFPNTELGLEHILQPDHIGRTLSITFGVHALTNTLENDRKRGLSLINEMYSPGITAMAAPVQRSGEPATYVITIAAP